MEPPNKSAPNAAARGESLPSALAKGAAVDLGFGLVLAVLFSLGWAFENTMVATLVAFVGGVLAFAAWKAFRHRARTQSHEDPE
jgi:positive regulator of sigma E activity